MGHQIELSFVPLFQKLQRVHEWQMFGWYAVPTWVSSSHPDEKIPAMTGVKKGLSICNLTDIFTLGQVGFFTFVIGRSICEPITIRFLNRNLWTVYVFSWLCQSILTKIDELTLRERWKDTLSEYLFLAFLQHLLLNWYHHAHIPRPALITSVIVN